MPTTQGKLILVQVRPGEIFDFKGCTLFTSTSPVQIKEVRGTRVSFVFPDGTSRDKYDLKGFYKPVLYCPRALNDEDYFREIVPSNFRLCGRFLYKKDIYKIGLPQPEERWFKEVRKIKMPINEQGKCFFQISKIQICM